MEKGNPQEMTLPTLAQIESCEIAIPGKLNALNVLLNQPPPSGWLKSHPMAKGVSYIPIDKIEYLLTKIFIQWSVEIKEIKLLANSVICTIKLHYQNPITGQMQWTDGVGACPLQTNAGEKASDFDKIKSDAVMKAAPAAKSYAVKDAAECLGKIFGKDLNRKDTIPYDGLLNDERFKGAKITEKG